MIAGLRAFGAHHRQRLERWYGEFRQTTAWAILAWTWDSAIRPGGLWAAVWQCGLALWLYTLADDYMFGAVKLPEALYRKPVVVTEALARGSVREVLLLLSAVPLLRWRQCEWKTFGDHRSLRWFVGGLAVVLAWAFAAYDYNLYLDQAHVWDRLLLVALALLVFRHPGFAGPFFVWVVVMTWQFSHPLGSFSWTDKRIIYQIILLFCVMLSIHGVRKIDWRLFLTLVLAMHASSYIVPGIGKNDLHWLSKDELDLLFVAAQSNGWLAGLQQSTALTIADLIHTFNKPMLWATMIIELAPAVLLIHRRGAMVIFVLCTLLHVMIFLSSGICFWKWGLLNIGLILLLRGRSWGSMFGLHRKFFWISIPVIYWGAELFNPVKLSWLETPLNNMYEIEAVGQSGQTYRVSRIFMSPYDIIFAQNRFPYLVKDPHVALTLGVTTSERAADVLLAAPDAQAGAVAAKRLARRRYNNRRAQRFRKFMQTYFANLNRHGRKPEFPILGAPHHIWMWVPGDRAYDSQEPVVEVRIRWVSQWYDGERVHELRNKVVDTIPIPAR